MLRGGVEPLGEIIARRRHAVGLSQSALASAAGVHMRQIRRYESGEQQPVLAVAVRLAAALGVTVDELAGLPSGRVQLDGTWWAAWQTFVAGAERIAAQPMRFSQNASTIEIEGLERGGHVWRGELRVWDGEILMGYYAAADGHPRSKFSMFFTLSPSGEEAEGRWVGLSLDGAIVSGHAALARTREEAQAVVVRLTAPPPERAAGPDAGG